MAALDGSFYEQPTIEVARQLLGCELIHELNGIRRSGIIVETEAYLHNDPASHSFRGLSSRNAAMFESPGTVYIYKIYGIHYCLNVVTGAEGTGEAVLIRALQPTEGLEAMRLSRRNPSMDTHLCNGPAKLVEALAIPPSYNGRRLEVPRFYIQSCLKTQSFNIVASPRIGITKAAEWPLRFHIMENKYVSRPSKIADNLQFGQSR